VPLYDQRVPAKPTAPTASAVPSGPTLPAVSLAGASVPASADVVVVATVPRGLGIALAGGGDPVDGAMGGRLAAALAAVGATGRADEVIKIPTLGQAPFTLVVATGLGAQRDATGDDHAANAAEALRRAAGAALRALGGTPARHVHIAIDGDVGALAEGALLGCYAFTRYKSGVRRPALRRISLSARADGTGRAPMQRARIIAEAVALTRDLVNSPPNDLYPETFAAQAAAIAEQAGIAAEVLDRRGLVRGGFGGILGVGGGSAHGPRLVRLDYRPRRAQAHVALVGKGITFDSGGLNLKTAHLTEMKSDMGGAAAVIAATRAAAALRLPIRVTTTVPMAENMVSGSAYRPSDVLRLRNGSTVEVTDTDAEGRLVLADAILRALEDEPDCLIETSTLTGAQLISLGPRVIGAMGTDALRDRVVAAGGSAGESVWPMPLPEELRAGLDSQVADIANVPADRWASMLVGGRFLGEYLPEGMEWVHLDIAGPAWNTGSARDYTPKGATGAAVRTLVAALEQLAS
jgi:leucyl aminopeptidase